MTVRLGWPQEAYPLPLVSAVTVYRFFQEALLNVVKHADVDEAEASLAVEGDQIVARVQRRRPGLRTRARCSPAAVGTSASACCGSGPGWPGAPSTWSPRPSTVRS